MSCCQWRGALLFAVCGAWFLSSGNGARTFKVEPGQAYGVLVSSPNLTAFGPGEKITASVKLPGGAVVASKQLHAGDPDLYVTVATTEPGALSVELNPPSDSISIAVKSLGKPSSPSAQLATAGHSTWQTAEPIELGRPVYASADDRPYIPALGDAKSTFDQMLAGIHWYKLEYKGPAERLVHFNVDILDRDVPADVAIFTIENGAPVEYTRGRERYETEKSTNFHGLAKFAPRVIAPGTYYIRVMANHPFYKLESDHYPPPPYTDPQLAIRAAMDYVVRKGDAWHANVPREGAVALRNASNLQETRLCIACHPTQFSSRGELFAVEAGYPVRARSSVQFLLERLHNNPRPIYGKTDASWARMIHAPGNVLSRVSYLAAKYEKLITGEHRPELHRGISAYLEMYWPGMTEPSHESNGNLPRISGFEVALHNAMLFDRMGRRELREQIERVIVNGKVDDTLDVCWKIDALVWLGREKYAAEIAALRDRLLSLQQPDGRWAMPFDLEEIQYDFVRQRKTVKKLIAREGQAGPRAADFQTWHAVYALARAGVTIEDPRIKKAVALCLSRQTPSGAWQGNPDYKNFDTPFRDTQYALMALSELYPGPKGRGGAKGWGAGFPAPPARFDDANAIAAIAALDQHWDTPAPQVLERIRSLATASPHVLVRYQAAVSLGRIGDSASANVLANALGDSSKLVQRAAAWSLRQIASRKNAGLDAISAALDSPAERTRWGALRIFNQHFKYLSEQWQIGERIRRAADADPVPVNKMAAAQALYQWWYWDRDVNHKSAIEDTLIAGLGRDEHPWARRAFIEGYYATLDDNVRYLYGSWIPRVKRPEDKKVIEDGHKGVVLAQATRYRDAMVSGNERMRDGLLRALYTHHIREGLPDVSAMSGVTLPPTMQGHWISGYKFEALFDPLTGGTAGFSRIGNDSEPPVFYKASAPVMNEAFLAALGGRPSPAIVTSAIRALKFVRTGLTIETALADRILDLLADSSLPQPVRGEVIEYAATLKRAPSPAKVRERLLAAKPEDRAFPALVTLAGPLLDDEAVRRHVLSGLASKRPQPQQAVLRFALDNADTLALPEDYPESYGPFAIGGALTVIAAPQQKTPAPLARRILLAGLQSQVHTIRTQALKTLIGIESAHKDPAVLELVARLKRDPEKEVRTAALSFETSQLARVGAAGSKAEDLLDYFYFKENVEPILLAKASDGDHCAKCHANHTLLKLNDADESGTLTLARSRANYNSVAAMVNVKDAEASLLLNKPVAPLDDAGIGDSQAFTHGGGVRWPDRKSSREYQTILRWIRGARLDAGSSAGGGGN